MKPLIPLLALAAMLSACGPNPQLPIPPLDPGQQAAPQQSGMGAGTGAILGGVAGYMLGRSANRVAAPAYSAPPVVHHTTVVNKTVVVKQYAPPRRSTYVPRSSLSRRR